MHRLTQTKHPDQKQPQVLVVEDDEDNLIYISHALAMFNYSTITTQDARNTIGLAIKYQPSLIILDIKMPYMSGVDLIQLLKINRLTPRIPVIAVTALARKQEKELILDSGFKGYLIKPFFLDDLKQMIYSFIVDEPFCQID